ncbi:MAG: DUF4188 domain-containing protein [Acidimicrobiales bacterium]
MGKAINKGRWTVPSQPEPEGTGEPVLFLIGMRINRLRAVRAWSGVARAMPKMLRELSAQPELGLLGARTYLSGRDLMVVQYWRSRAHLDNYARAAEHLHLPAWRAFNKAVAASGRVGIWHESHTISVGEMGAVYTNMPPVGLAHALGGAVPANNGHRASVGGE